jgi:hypothetical protein
MTMEAKIPTLADAELATLLSNAERLTRDGSDRQRLEAERLMPAIKDELARRRASAPPRPARKAPAKRAVKRPTKSDAPA